MKACRKALIIMITFLMGITLCSCSSKTKSAREELEDYLNKVQWDPSSLTSSLKLQADYQAVVNELVSEYEYVITKEEDFESSGKMEAKAFNVDFKGYDIGPYFQKWLDTYQYGIYVKLSQEYSLEELMDIYQNNPDHFKTISEKAALEYFKDIMGQCKDAGKTYVAEGMYGIVMYWFEKTKQWAPNPLAKTQHLDFITDYLYSIWKANNEKAEYPEDKTVVGRDVNFEDLTDFSFIYENTSTEHVYQKYHYYVEDGKYMLAHERRENQGGPLTENDIVSSGTRELTVAQWASFFSWIKGGTVEETQVNENFTITINWNGNEADDRPYNFRSFSESTQFQINSYNLAHSE